jgi:tetratricopeptide (TPR) repeat protein
VIALNPRKGEAYLGLAVVQDQNKNFWHHVKDAGGDSAVAREHRDREADLRRGFLVDPLADIRILGYGDPHHYGLPPGLNTGNYRYAYNVANAVEGGLRRRIHVRDSLPLGFLWWHGLLAAHANIYGDAIEDLALIIHRMQRIEENDSLHVVPLPINGIRYVLAAVQQRAGNRAQAIALYREVIENDVGNYMAQVQLAAVHEAGQEWSQAIEARRAAITANPDEPLLQLDLAATLFNARFTARAETALVNTGPVLRHDPRYLYLMGRVELALGKNDQARNAFTEFLTMAPSRWTDAIDDARKRLDNLH